LRLFCDQGNSRLKWRLLDDADGIVHHGAVPKLAWADMCEQLLNVPLPNAKKSMAVSVIWISSVLEDESKAEFAQYLQSVFNLYPQFARVFKGFLGVEPAYEDLSTLGVDRWLAFSALFKDLGKACVAISAGSAITVDFVNDQGRHMGGLIYPGVGLMKEAMGRKSAALDLDLGVERNNDWQPGKSTSDCIANALSAGVSGLLQQVCAYAQTELGDPQVYISGGDAAYLEARFPGKCIFKEGLVFDGLLALSRQ